MSKWMALGRPEPLSHPPITFQERPGFADRCPPQNYRRRTKFLSQLTYRRPGVLGLDTFTTKTSAKGPNTRTPEIKSSIESAGDSLFLPRLTASTAPSRRAALSGGPPKKFGIRARIRERTEECPCDGKPYRFMTASSSSNRNMRGRGFPGWQLNYRCGARRLISNAHLRIWCNTSNLYPAKTKIKKTYVSALQYVDIVENDTQFLPSIASPSLSNPAAKPMGFETASPHIYRGI